MQKNPIIINYIEEQTEDLCLIACKTNGLVLQYIKNQTDVICLEACENNILAFQNIKSKNNNLIIKLYFTNRKNMFKSV